MSCKGKSGGVEEMTKKELVRLVYMSGHCPEYNCQHTTSAQCTECHNKELTEYENEIYNKALEDFEERAIQQAGYIETEEGWGGMVIDTKEIKDIKEQLKKGAENET